MFNQSKSIRDSPEYMIYLPFDLGLFPQHGLPHFSILD